MDDRYTQAIKTSILEMEVCGRVLKPMCLRHRLILEEIESPAVMTDKRMSPMDLVLACRILSTYSLKEMLAVKPDEMDKRGFKSIFLSDENYNTEMIKFSDYIIQQDNAPVLWDKKTKGDGRGVGVILSCVSSLIRNGIPYERAWTMPESEAVWMYVANAVSNGADINVVSLDDKKAMEMLNKMNIPTKK